MGAGISKAAGIAWGHAVYANHERAPLGEACSTHLHQGWHVPRSWEPEGELSVQ